MIPYTRPSITQLEIDYANDAVTNGWGKHCYDYITKFEQKFSEYLGVKYAVSTSSCTGALTLGLAALDILPGDEVILADTNWVATVAPIVQLGAIPVFVDIDPVTWCINHRRVEEKITTKTRAIIATHLYGNLADLNSIEKIAEQNNLYLIEDAAEALGSRYFGQYAGSIGFFGTFSFHGSKTITTGEGGMLVTNDKELYEIVVKLNNHGRDHSQMKQFWPDTLGYKFRISNIQAAVGCAQLERVDQLVSKKRQILSYYTEKLRHIDGLVLNQEQKGCVIGAWMPNLVFDANLGLSRERILKFFKSKNIDARVFFWPLSELPMFENEPKNRIAKDIASRAINLPSFFDISEDECDKVIEVVHQLLEA